jgi:hypothetical protein
MKLSDYKLEIFFISVLITSIIGVVIWFILDYFSLDNSIEIAVISTLVIIMIFVSFLLHGRGLLPEPEITTKIISLDKNYTRRKIRMNIFTREKYLNFLLKKRRYNKFYKK